MGKQNKVLFVVHVEEMFRRFFPDPMYVHRLYRSVNAKRYDRVIFLTSGIDDMEPIEELRYSVREQWDWSWGYEKEMWYDDDQEETNWTIPTSSVHEWTWVPPEIRNNPYFKNCKAYVAGGYESECLQDWLDVLDHVGIEYEKIQGLIY